MRSMKRCKKFRTAKSQAMDILHDYSEDVSLNIQSFDRFNYVMSGADTISRPSGMSKVIGTTQGYLKSDTSDTQRQTSRNMLEASTFLFCRY